MANLKIDGISIDVEQGIEYVEDGTEEFDIGTYLIKNTTRRTPYPDYADVEFTIGNITIEMCLKSDTVQSISRGDVVYYNHTVTFAEVVLKLSMYPHPDRLFTTKNATKTTYKVHVEELIKSAFYGRTAPITILQETLDALDIIADEKEYSGGNLFKSIIDAFRDSELIPTLNLNNELGHKDIRQIKNEIEFDKIDGEIITSDINDYALRIFSKVKNATYESDLITGGTYFPDRSNGVTPRSINDGAKFDDANAGYVLDSGIRRMIVALGKNIQTDNQGIQINVPINIVSKEEWEDLLVNREYASATPGASVYENDYQNNTLYFIEGDNKIYNCGVEYEYNGITIGQPKDALSQAIRRGVFKLFGNVGEYVPQTIRNIEMNFFYQPQRDIDTVQERHDIERVKKIATITNQQKDSKLELARFGNANKQAINRMGNDTYQITVRYPDETTANLFDVGDYTEDAYRIIKRQFLIMNDSIDVTYLLTKNQSILNPTTSVKRNFTSPFTISRRNIKTNYVYQGYIEFSDSEQNTELLENNLKPILFNALEFEQQYNTPIWTAQYRRGGQNQIFSMSAMSIPMGNSFQFHAQFNHPKFAGYSLVSDTVGDKLESKSYGDENGEVETSDITFAHDSLFNPNDFPIATFNSNWILRPPSLAEMNLNPDEIMAITYALHCVTDDPNFYIGNYFLDNNCLVKTLAGTSGTKLIWYDKSNNPNYTPYDKFQKGNPDGVGTFTIQSKKYIEVSDIPNGASWALVKDTAPYELYFAYNNRGIDKTRKYLNLRLDRKDTEIL